MPKAKKKPERVVTGFEFAAEASTPPATEKIFKRFEFDAATLEKIKEMESVGFLEPRRLLFEFTNREWFAELVELATLICINNPKSLPAHESLSAYLRWIDKGIESEREGWSRGSHWIIAQMFCNKYLIAKGRVVINPKKKDLP